MKREGYIGHLLEVVFDLLGVGWAPVPFDLSKWDFNDFYLNAWSPDSDTALPLMAAYLYWKTLCLCPSIVRLWWMECKDRQFSLAIEGYTEKYMSPSLVKEQSEKLESKKASLQDMKVRVSKTGHDISASYMVDDASLDISIKFPLNYPLRQVDVEAGNGKVGGVPEGKWRAWLLATTTLMVSQNGSVYDALRIFQRNVSLHFEGVEDCAICYSIIGVIDNTLPSKQCKNCKHKFHSACLFKWFKTSNQSTCPLCRQTSF